MSDFLSALANFINPPAIEQPAQLTAEQIAEQRALAEAKRVILKRIEFATSDHNGKHISESRWQWLVGMVENL